MEKAKTDRTYCVNKECKIKCNRHESHYEFEENKLYIWQNHCEDFLRRNKND